MLRPKNLALAKAAGPLVFHNQLINILRNCLVVSDEQFNKLNVIDYFMILLQLRLYFIDDEIVGSISCDCVKPLHVKFNISSKLEELDKVFNLKHTQKIKDHGTSFEFDLPKIRDIPTILNSNSFEGYSFLHISKINDFTVCDKTIEQRKNVYEQLPYDVISWIKTHENKLNNLQVIDYINIKCQKCNFSLNTTLDVPKMLDLLYRFFYAFDFDSCLYDYAKIAKHLNISPSYIETISPMEKMKYIDMLTENKNGESSVEELSPNSDFGF